MFSKITYLISLNYQLLAKLFLVFFILLSGNIVNAKDQIKIVAITQIVEHDSLNKVRDGIIDVLKGHYADKIIIQLSNASGNIVTASQIASKLVANEPDLIIAISTPSAQTVKKSAQHSKIPILFASVTDPVGAGLVDSLKNPGGNISGTRNSSPVKKQLTLAKELIPHLKKIGVVLNMSEANSVFMLKTLEETAQELEIKVESKAIINSGDVKLATESLVSQVDAFFLIQDSSVASSLPSLIKAATKAGKPVISSYVEAVKLGALAGLAFDEYQIGEQTARMAIKALEGTSPKSIAVEDPEKISLEINEQVAKTFGIIIPKTINQLVK